MGKHCRMRRERLIRPTGRMSMRAVTLTPALSLKGRGRKT
ncbi:hypothetical protein HMPREF9346_03599 [Escherichia coli MS 119-7]|nr:hypothetical protein HMPREF9346_03599 [Escherichia coli MS 119-7]